MDILIYPLKCYKMLNNSVWKISSFDYMGPVCEGCDATQCYQGWVTQMKIPDVCRHEGYVHMCEIQYVTKISSMSNLAIS
jgi:hypothetical protein